MKGLLNWLFYSLGVAQRIISISGPAVNVEAIYHLSLDCTSINLHWSNVWNSGMYHMYQPPLKFGCLKGG